jgi:hypothetical protein
MAARKMLINAADIKPLTPKMVPAARSREIRKLKDAGLLLPADSQGGMSENGRSYVLASVKKSY